jgi:type II secretory pathway pseudopilin PulG
MNPQLSYHASTARVADLHQQAERERLARAALRERRSQGGHPAPRVPARRRVLAFLGARSA